ncbi:MAG: glycosyltransferase [Planctomycetota bacterium]
MRVSVVLEYAHGRPWDHTGPWGAAFSRALAERGHEVTVFADGVADRDRFGDRVRVEVRRSNRRSIEGDPLGFAGWVGERVRAHCGASLSLTRAWAGDVWVPMGRSAADEIRRLASLVGRPATFAMQSRERLWVLAALVAERRARAEAKRRGVAVLSIGEPVFAGVRTVGPTSPRLGDDRSSLSQSQSQPGSQSPSRSAVRAMLGIGADEVVLVASAVHHQDDAFAAFLGGAAEVGARVIVTGGRPHLVTRRAQRADAEKAVIAMGQTERMDALIEASDAVVVPGGDRGVRVRGTGRLVAEAVCAGRPVFVGPRAAGVGSVRGPWGVRVGDDWSRGLLPVMDAAWRVSASEAALQTLRLMGRTFCQQRPAAAA